MKMHVGIAGAGLSGRLVALACLARGWSVTLFDKDNCLGQDSCGFVAAGMLAPFTELESSELLITRLGLDALAQWPSILQQLHEPVSLSQKGTLILAHPQDRNEREHLMSAIHHKLRQSDLADLHEISTSISRDELQQMIPGLATDLHDGYWIHPEGHLDTHEFYQASTKTLQALGVQWHQNTPVLAVRPYHIDTATQQHQFDLVFDCRGLGAQADWLQLRGIRGEVLCLQTKEVHLSCPVRILHPRYPIYISPRKDNVFLVGATAIESEDTSPISAQSMLELLSCCYMVHPGFAEARIIKTMTQSRPTLPDNHPRIVVQQGLMRINGLYRHGYLIGPSVIKEAFSYIEHGQNGLKYPELIHVVEESTACISC